MDAAGIAVGFSLCATILISLITLFLLWRVPLGLTRNLAVILMAIIIPASLLMLFGISRGLGGLQIYTVSLSDLLIYWSTPVILHLILSFSKLKRISNTWMGHTILYLPILILTVLLMATGLALPSEIRVNETTVPLYADFGFLSPLFMAGGILYIACTIILLIWMLKSGAGQLKKELLMIIGVILLAIGTAFLLILFYHNISFSAVYSIIGSLLGLILGNAALKRSTLIVPQRETRTVERPVELLRPGATYLFLVACSITPVRHSSSGAIATACVFCAGPFFGPTSPFDVSS